MRTSNKLDIVVCLAVFSAAAPLHAQLDTITNGASFGMWRTNWINPAILQVNTNTLDIAALETDVIAVSNAFVAADAALSNALGTAAFLDSGTNNGDLVLMESLSAWAVDTNDFATAAQGTLADSAMQPADGTAVSNGLTSAYAAADTAVSNAFIAADAALSNLLAGAGSITLGQATNIARYVVSQSNSLYATAAQGSTADSAMQPADGTALSNGLTSAYAAADTAVSNAFIAADTALSNALAGAGGGGTATVPVSPYGLEFAYTFDADLTNDWWGSSAGTNTTLTQEFDTVQGGGFYIPDQNPAAGRFTSPTVTVGSNYTMFVKFKVTTGTGSWTTYIIDQTDSSPTFWVYQVANGNFAFSYNDTADTGSSTENAWHTFSINVSTDGMQSYLDAEEFSSSAAVLTFTDTLVLGREAASNAGDLRCASFYLWSRTLSSNEVARLHALEINGQYGVQGLRRP